MCTKIGRVFDHSAFFQPSSLRYIPPGAMPSYLSLLRRGVNSQVVDRLVSDSGEKYELCGVGTGSCCLAFLDLLRFIGAGEED